MTTEKLYVLFAWTDDAEVAVFTPTGWFSGPPSAVLALTMEQAEEERDKSKANGLTSEWTQYAIVEIKGKADGI